MEPHPSRLMLINAKSAYHTEYIWVAATGDMYVCQCDTGQQGDDQTLKKKINE